MLSMERVSRLHPCNSIHTHDYEVYEHELNMEGILTPVSISKLDKFEQQNLHISINVFGCEDKEIFPMRITKEKNQFHHINLLYLKDGDKTHYCLIKNLNTFLQKTKKSNCNYFFSVRIVCMAKIVRQSY